MEISDSRVKRFKDFRTVTSIVKLDRKREPGPKNREINIRAASNSGVQKLKRVISTISIFHIYTNQQILTTSELNFLKVVIEHNRIIL